MSISYSITGAFLEAERPVLRAEFLATSIAQERQINNLFISLYNGNLSFFPRKKKTWITFDRASTIVKFRPQGIGLAMLLLKVLISDP